MRSGRIWRRRTGRGKRGSRRTSLCEACTLWTLPTDDPAMNLRLVTSKGHSAELLG
jgi:hypothetical protein